MADFTTHLSQQMILAVDDELDNLEVLKTTLEVLYNTVVCIATNCQEALARLETFKPTLIIADISMPQVDGFGLLKLLRERPDTAKLPIIALTAYAMKGDQERILNAGFDGYIGKPYDILAIGDELELHLRNFFAHQSQNVSTPETNSEPNTRPSFLR